MIYIDEDLVPKAIQTSNLMHDVSFDDWSGAPVDMFVSMNPIYTDLRRGLVRYQQRWGNLPSIPVPTGPTLKTGMTATPEDIARFCREHLADNKVPRTIVVLDALPMNQNNKVLKRELKPILEQAAAEARAKRAASA